MYFYYAVIMDCFLTVDTFFGTIQTIHSTQTSELQHTLLVLRPKSQKWWLPMSIFFRFSETKQRIPTHNCSRHSQLFQEILRARKQYQKNSMLKSNIVMV